MTTTPDLWRNPFIDSTNLTGDQRDGVVAATNGDQFFAAWVDFNLPTSEIIARKFDIVGNPLTAEVHINPFGLPLIEPAAVRLPIAGQADGLAVAFTLINGADDDIWVVRKDAALANIGVPIEINFHDGFADHPSITSFSNGSLWVAFTLHSA